MGAAACEEMFVAVEVEEHRMSPDMMGITKSSDYDGRRLAGPCSARSASLHRNRLQVELGVEPLPLARAQRPRSSSHPRVGLGRTAGQFTLRPVALLSRPRRIAPLYTPA